VWYKLKTHDMKMSSWNFEHIKRSMTNILITTQGLGILVRPFIIWVNYHCVFAIRCFSQSSFSRKSLIIFYYICKHILLIFVYHSPWMDSANIFLIIIIFQFLSFSTRLLSSKHFGINNMINKWNHFVTSVFLLYYV
jgi:hypothetical protein